MKLQNSKTYIPRIYLKKLCHLLILAIIFSVPLIYPFKISHNALRTLVGWFEKQGYFAKSLWDWQLEPFLYFGLSPLKLKWTVVDGFILVFAVAYIFWRILEPVRSGRFRITPPYVFLHTLLLYAGFSAIFISPTIHTSVMSLISLVLAVVFFIGLADVDKSPAFVVKAFVLIGLVSFVLCVIAVMQHTGLTDSFMLRFERLRNSMGSFIGHNTGLSSYIMPSFFMAIAALTLVRKLCVRFILMAFLAIEGFVIVAAQSRAVILILLFLTPLYLLYLWRLTGFRIRARWMLTAAAVLCIVVLLQIVNRPWNPFYSHKAPLVKRLKAFQPRNLRGTRLRILTCSRALLRQSPFFGYGFASFQYVYPKAQADYYASHPDTLLIPTDLRTQHAHNEYLQTAIGLGFVGLFLVLLTLYLFLKQGQIVLQEVQTVWVRRFLCALFFSIVAFLLHSFVDFPMQIPPLSLMILLLLGIWVSGEKIWLRKNNGEENLPPLIAKLTASTGGRVLLIAGALIMFALLPLGNAIILRPFRSDIIFFKSDMYIQTFHEYPNISDKEKLNLLTNAVAIARRGVRLDPLNCELRFKLGEAYYLLGTFYTKEWLAAKKAKDEREENAWKLGAQQYLTRAVNKLTTALEEYRFHSVYYLIGVSEEMLERIEPNKGHLARAREAYSIAVRYSPAFAEALADYSKLLVKISRTLPESRRAKLGREIIRLRRLIAKYQPEYFRKHFVEKTRTSMLNCEYERVIKLFVDLLRIEPDNLDFRAHLANVLAKEARFNDALGVLAEAQRMKPDYAPVLRAYALVFLRKKDYAEALKYIQKYLTLPQTNDKVFEVLEALTLKAMGKSNEAKLKLDAIEKKALKDPGYLQMLGTISIEFFGKEKEGIKYLERRVNLTPPPTEILYYTLATYKLKQGDRATAISYLKRAIESRPDYKKAKNLLKHIQSTSQDSTP